ncbi:MAG: class Ib ribonucleoside-diphosphate reductase assembly flavoprotein NrdI [Lysinibacillus sp.]
MIAYLSRTGNVKYIISQLNLPSIEIVDGLKLEEPFVVCTYTDGLGDVPSQVEKFMAQNYVHCVGVIVSGNRNFGSNFGLAGHTLASRYNVPLISKLDLRGQASDYEQIRDFFNLK